MESMSNLDYLDEADAIRLVRLSIAGVWDDIVILHKSECFFVDDYKRVRVTGDVIAWLTAYCRSEYKVKSVEMQAKVVDFADMQECHTGFEGKIYFVAFEDENEALHFKMRWGGR